MKYFIGFISVIPFLVVDVDSDGDVFRDVTHGSDTRENKHMSRFNISTHTHTLTHTHYFLISFLLYF